MISSFSKFEHTEADFQPGSVLEMLYLDLRANGIEIAQNNNQKERSGSAKVEYPVCFHGQTVLRLPEPKPFKRDVQNDDDFSRILTDENNAVSYRSVYNRAIGAKAYL